MKLHLNADLLPTGRHFSAMHDFRGADHGLHFGPGDPVAPKNVGGTPLIIHAQLHEGIDHVLNGLLDRLFENLPVIRFCIIGKLSRDNTTGPIDLTQWVLFNELCIKICMTSPWAEPRTYATQNKQ
jgi:hypothetical protein